MKAYKHFGVIAVIIVSVFFTAAVMNDVPSPTNLLAKILGGDCIIKESCGIPEQSPQTVRENINRFCASGWECSSWSNCVNNKQQRTCINADNSCNNKPLEEVNCQGSAGEVLFDIELDLLAETIIAGETLLGTLKLINVGDPGETPITIEYYITDHKNNILRKQTEDLTLQTQAEFLKDFPTETLKPGEYSIHMHLFYQDQQDPASSHKIFFVDRKPGSTVSLLLMIFLVTILAFFVTRTYRRKSEQNQ